MEETRWSSSTAGERRVHPAERGGRAIICLESSERLSGRLREFLAGLDCPSEFILAHSLEDPSILLALCRRLAPAVIAAEADRLAALPLGELRELIARGDVRILAFARGTSTMPYEALLRKGCSGVLPADVGDETLKRAIEAIFAGELWAPRSVLSTFARETIAKDRSRELTQREADIHKLICLGLTNQQIATQLFISRETVRWHVRSLYAKLGVPNQRRAMLETGNVVNGNGAAAIS